ncbi:MAG: hypothetical protein RR319_05090 [Bacteroides sp.]
MYRLLKIHILAFCCSLSVYQAQAQAPTAIGDSVPKFFNALNYSLQKRYIAPGDTFTNKKWYDNTYFSVYGGIEKLIARGLSDFGSGPVFGVTFGKMINKNNALRLSATSGWFTRRETTDKLLRFGAEVSHLFNITSYVNGFNPSRTFEISTLEGIGYQYTSFENMGTHVGELHLGLNLKFHPAKRTDLFIEPRVTFYTDGVDHSEGKNWHNYDIGYGATAGLTYWFSSCEKSSRHKNSFEDDNFLDNTFISFQTGGQIQLSHKAKDKVGLMKSIGPHASLSIGKWFFPLFGARLSAFASLDEWNKEIAFDDDDWEEVMQHDICTYAGGRLEAMINPLFLWKDYRSDYPFNISLLLGAEGGHMLKEDAKYRTTIVSNYFGFTGGLQIKCRVGNSLSLFLEPRLSRIPYSIYEPNPHNPKKLVHNYYNDNVFSLNLGMEFGRSTSSQRSSFIGSNRHFKPNNFVSLIGGFNTPFNFRNFHNDKRLGYQVAIQGGRNFTPYSSLRLELDMEKTKVNTNAQTVPVSEYKTFSLSADYLLSLSNLMFGYDSQRRFKADCLLGLVLTHQSTPLSKMFLGGETGVQLSYEVWPHFDVKAESRIRIYSSKFFLQNLDERADNVVSFLGGVAYKF